MEKISQAYSIVNTFILVATIYLVLVASAGMYFLGLELTYRYFKKRFTPWSIIIGYLIIFALSLLAVFLTWAVYFS